MLSCRLRKKLYHIFNYVFVRSTFISNAGNVLPPHLHLYLYIHLHLHFHYSFFSTLSFHYLHTFLCCASLHSFSRSFYLSLSHFSSTLTYHTVGKKLRFGFYHKKNYNSVLSTMHNIPSLSSSLSLSPIHSLTQTISVDLSALP